MIFCLKHPARVMTVLCRKLSVTLFMVFFRGPGNCVADDGPGNRGASEKSRFYGN